MSIVCQRVCCPVCGASRKLEEFGLTERGNLLPDGQQVIRLPILKIQHNEGHGKIRWEQHQLPPHALQFFIQHLENILESAKQQLSDQLESGGFGDLNDE
jgi:hypothetical protein